MNEFKPLDFGFYNMDCMEGMKQFPDKYFDLAIVDPPYGGAQQLESNNDLNTTNYLMGGGMDWETKPRSRFGGRVDKYEIKATEPVFDKRGRLPAAGRGEKYAKHSYANQTGKNGAHKDYGVERTDGTWAAKDESKIKHWDIAPPTEYFNELARISKNQIIWGGNYFALPPTRCFIVWKKLTISEKFTMAMCEYAWTSFNENAKLFECAPQGSVNEPRFHPTQKPIPLYTWILNNYAKKGDKILDTHVGSASSLIACHKLGFQYVGFELDEDYFKLASARLEAVKSQPSIFELSEHAEQFKQENFIEGI